MNERCETVGGGGDTPTEPYIASHHLLLAHAMAAKVYREKYQVVGGEIGMDINVGYNEPYNATNSDDIEAVYTKFQFEFGWYVDPLMFGKYPDIMV